MKNSLRIAVLSTLLALTASPVFAAGPGSNDPPPPNPIQGASVTTTQVIYAVLTALGA